MMKVSKRNLLIIAAILFILTALIMSIVQKKPKGVPFDNLHRPFYEAIQKGSPKTQIETGCTACHRPQSIPLPKKHPPKEQCLICHKLIKSK